MPRHGERLRRGGERPLHDGERPLHDGERPRQLAQRLRGLRRLVTPRGAGTAGAAVGLYAAGVGLGYPELCVLAAAAALALAAGALCLLPGASVLIGREIAPPKVARGDAAIGVVKITNVGRRGVRALLATDSIGGLAATVPVPRLAPTASRTLSYRLPTSARGRVPVGPLTLWRLDPFGFFARGISQGDVLTLIVRPRTVPLPPLASGRAVSLDGPAADNAPGGSTTFHALREYAFGDDLRHIHWRSTARKGTLMVRQLIDTSEPRTTVVLETESAAYATAADFEEAVDVAASVTVCALGSGFPAVLMTSTGPLFSARGGRVDADALLDLLAMIEPDGAGQGGLAGAMRHVARRRTDGTLIAITGGAPAPVLERVAEAGAAFQRSMAIRIGHDLPPLPLGLVLPVLDVTGAEALGGAWAALASG